MADREWEPVTVAGKEIVSSDRGRVVIEWTLAGGVDGDWVGSFRGDGRKEGTFDYVSSEPQVSVSGVRWEVAEGNMGFIGFWRGLLAHRTTIEPSTRQLGLPA
jgi:hypothetical protein